MDFKQFISLALAEDIGDGDHTSLSCIPADSQQVAKLIAKQDGVIAGLEVAIEVFRQVDAELAVNLIVEDGDPIKVGDVILELRGNARSILTGERLALNFLQRMSGIATYTAHLNQLIAGTSCQLLDTRKTTPGLRYFEKLAVKLGGGVNHRFGLYDMIMIKDNHVDYAGGINQAMTAVQDYLKAKNKDLKVVVEARSREEVEQIIAHGSVDRILLDNFSPSDMAEVVNIIPPHIQTEASGGITESTIRAYAETGVNYISVGALTHQIKSLDMSLKATV